MKRILLTLFFFITTLGVFATPITYLSAFYRSGQVFVTWNNLSIVGVEYNLYRSTVPITSGKVLASAQNLGWVPDSSSVNKRVTQLQNGLMNLLTIDSLGESLALQQGLFVATSSGNGMFYYAVTTTVNGVEDTTIIVGQNSLTKPISETVSTPRPVMQQVRHVGSTHSTQLLYVQFLTNVTSPNYPVMTKYGCFPANFSVLETPGTTPFPGKCKLHGGGSNFLQDTGASEIIAGMWNIALDDWTPGCPGTSWVGYNQNDNMNLNKYIVPTSGFDMLYTQRRIAYTIQWVCRNFPVDSTKMTVYGSSEGGIGTIFTSSTIPNKVAMAYEYTGMFNLGFGNDPNGDVAMNTNGAQRKNMNFLFGTVASNLVDDQGLNLFTQGNAGYMLRMNRDANYPLYFGINGKNDMLVGWYEKIAFYDSANANRLGGSFYWDLRTHGGGPRSWVLNPIYSRYSTSLSYPAFANCSANNNPGDGYSTNGDSVGTINGMLDWKDQIVDSQTVWQISLYVKNGNPFYVYGTFPTPDSCTVDVTPRRLQNFKPVHGATIYYVNKHHGVVVASGVASYDGNLIVIPQLKVYNDTNTLRLTIDPSEIDTEKTIPVQVTATKTRMCIPALDTLTASGASTYVWTANPGNGNPSVGIGPSIIVEPSVTTTYTVTGTNINGIKGTQSIVVTISADFSATITASGSTSFCQGSSVELLASPTGSNYTYQWYGNKKPLNGSTAPTLVAAQSGLAYVIITSSSDKTCSVTSNSITVKEKPNPSAIISVVGSNTIYAGDSARLVAQTHAAYQYQWVRGNTVIAGATNYVYYAKQQGFYACIVTDSGCSVTSAAIEIDSTGYVPIQVTATFTQSCVKGAADTLKASGAVQYEWTSSPNYNVIGTSSILVVAPTATTTYIATGVDSFGNEGSQSIVIAVGPAFTASITAVGSTSFCPGGSVQLNASPAGNNYTYQWYGNNIKLTGAIDSSYTANRSGTALVVVTLASNSACTSTSNSIQLTQNTYPITNIAANGDTVFCSGDSVALYVSSRTGYLFQWFDEGALVPLATKYYYFAKNSGNYDCLITSSGCSKSTATIGVTANICGSPDETEMAKQTGTAQTAASNTTAGFTVSPDPNNGNFYLTFNIPNSGTPNYLIEVTNMLGQIIYTQKGQTLNGIYGNQLSLPSSAVSGCYLLRVITGNTVLTQKVIVTR